MNTPSPRGIEALIYRDYYRDEFIQRVNSASIREFWIDTIGSATNNPIECLEILNGEFDARTCE